MSDPLPLALASHRLRRRPGRPRKVVSAPACQASAPQPSPPLTRLPEPAVAALWPMRARVLGLKASADYLGVSTWTVRAYLAAGRLRRVRLPGPGGGELERLLLDREDLDRLVEDAKA